MKILLTIEDISYGRGAERVTVNLANAFAECGYEVSILSFYQRHPKLPYINFVTKSLFDTLVVLSTKELDTWQKYHNFVRVIPNFLPKFPNQSTNKVFKFTKSLRISPCAFITFFLQLVVQKKQNFPPQKYHQKAFHIRLVSIIYTAKDDTIIF